jgi:hypothetical protein
MVAADVRRRFLTRKQFRLVTSAATDHAVILGSAPTGLTKKLTNLPARFHFIMYGF